MPIKEKPSTPDDSSTAGQRENAVKNPACKDITVKTRAKIGSVMKKEKQSSAFKDIQALSSRSQPEYREGVIHDDLLREMGALLEENTLEAHEKALKLLEDSALLAVQRWESIHSNTDSGHNFSTVSAKRVNAFAKKVLDSVTFNDPSIMVELGTGFGNDAMFFVSNSIVHLIGIDSSQTAVQKVNENIKRKGINEQIVVVCDDFICPLEMCKNAGVELVYSHSTLHYSPPLILRDKIFPLIAETLRRKSFTKKHGKFCLAMKTAGSASAKSPNQRRLLENDPYHSSVDLHDKVFRIYPESKEALIALLEPSFDILEAEEVPFRGYDRTGDTEIFCYIIAKPKKKVK